MLLDRSYEANRSILGLDRLDDKRGLFRRPPVVLFWS